MRGSSPPMQGQSPPCRSRRQRWLCKHSTVSAQGPNLTIVFLTLPVLTQGGGGTTITANKLHPTSRPACLTVIFHALKYLLRAYVL